MAADSLAALLPLPIALPDYLSRGSAIVTAEEELAETRELVQAVEKFLENYAQMHARTAYAARVTRAQRRVEEALTDCMRHALEELRNEPVRTAFERFLEGDGGEVEEKQTEEEK